MIANLRRVFSDTTPGLRPRVIGIYSLLISVNILLWALTFAASVRYAALLPLAVTAYGFGLRHAVDADHISAIDNVTRKLMQEKKRPVAVGFFFSLGHSTVVIVMTILIAVAAVAVQNFDQMKAIGGLIGTTVSALFLFLIAIINIVVLIDVYRTFREVKN